MKLSQIKNVESTDVLPVKKFSCGDFFLRGKQLRWKFSLKYKSHRRYFWFLSPGYVSGLILEKKYRFRNKKWRAWEKYPPPWSCYFGCLYCEQNLIPWVTFILFIFLKMHFIKTFWEFWSFSLRPPNVLTWTLSYCELDCWSWAKNYILCKTLI